MIEKHSDRRVVLTPVCSGYYVKYDGTRKTHKWTAIGPKGRIGPDYSTDKEAYDAIDKEKDSSG